MHMMAIICLYAERDYMWWRIRLSRAEQGTADKDAFPLLVHLLMLFVLYRFVLCGLMQREA